MPSDVALVIHPHAGTKGTGFMSGVGGWVQSVQVCM